jgi:hypothetical protein
MKLLSCLLLLSLCLAGSDSWAFGRKRSRVARETEATLNQMGMSVKLDKKLDSDISELLLRDFQELKGRDLRSLDWENREEFEAMFGGTDGQAVIRYLSKRLHGFVASDSDASIFEQCSVQGYLRYLGFLNDPNEEEKMKQSGGEVGAANVGAALYYISAVNAAPISCKVGGSIFPVTSTRAGLMIFGPGYKEKETLFWPFKVTIPASYRQAILVHEARHSDCPGGLPESGLEVARRSHDLVEFDLKFKNRTCGHLHKLCPEGHQFAGVAACDDVPYGSYYFGGVFAESVGDVALLDPEANQGLVQEWSIMRSVAADAFSRLTFSRDDLQAGKLGRLDLSSDGEVSSSVPNLMDQISGSL